ncbi:unnamed protein product [Protopolystoma xenopodis]|uniref:Uncharacterized protein n=1 Tax=Protopolystoma xenopodis TaxID=117903 RepID=A0A3S5BD44_9PLAT|nr:unnamed protein product [Protopolystoma xenopodis]
MEVSFTWTLVHRCVYTHIQATSVVSRLLFLAMLRPHFVGMLDCFSLDCVAKCPICTETVIRGHVIHPPERPLLQSHSNKQPPSRLSTIVSGQARFALVDNRKETTWDTRSCLLNILLA